MTTEIRCVPLPWNSIHSSPADLCDRCAKEFTKNIAAEQALGEILEHLLGIQRADPEDFFLQLGGESLTAFRLLIEIEAAFAVQLRPVEVFDLKLGEIASRIEELQAQSSPPAS